MNLAASAAAPGRAIPRPATSSARPTDPSGGRGGIMTAGRLSSPMGPTSTRRGARAARTRSPTAPPSRATSPRVPSFARDTAATSPSRPRRTPAAPSRGYRTGGASPGPLFPTSACAKMPRRRRRRTKGPTKRRSTARSPRTRKIQRAGPSATSPTQTIPRAARQCPSEAARMTRTDGRFGRAKASE